MLGVEAPQICLHVTMTWRQYPALLLFYCLQIAKLFILNTAFTHSISIRAHCDPYPTLLSHFKQDTAVQD
jgi:hypothetical protein